MSLIQKIGRGRIPLHRSVRYVRFDFWRFAGWIFVALVATWVQIHFNQELNKIYFLMLNKVLNFSQVPFDQGTWDHLGFIDIPSWSVATFNPAAVTAGALAYLGAGLFLAVAVWWIPKIPFPMKAWISMLGALLLIVTVVLTLMPIPRFTPEVFSGLWMKVVVATSLIFPWVWALLVGVLPLPILRVTFWGVWAWIVFGVWNMIRLAFFLALARAAGVVWLPIAFIFGSTLMDCFVFIIAFSRVLEPAGQEWAEPA
jgi:magnesium-transporting ATPase (P-type)